jgi:hypothetical protein
MYDDPHSYHFIKKDKYKKIQKRIQSFATIKQEWDYEKLCQYCSCLYLKSQSIRKQCCMEGMALQGNNFPNFGDLPTTLAFYTYERLEHMSAKSSFYNGVLALGATAIDNGTGGGWEKIVGDHSVKLHGRTYHFLPQTGGCGGLEYFTFNAQEMLMRHADSLNGNICQSILDRLFSELKFVNLLIQECEQSTTNQHCLLH